MFLLHILILATRMSYVDIIAYANCVQILQLNLLCNGVLPDGVNVKDIFKQNESGAKTFIVAKVTRLQNNDVDRRLVVVL